MNRAQAHKNACRKFRKWYSDKHGGYTPCERCNRSDQMFYDPCHIFSVGKYSHHPEVHNFKNIFMGCRSCHDLFDSYQLEDFREQLIEERGLRTLFINDK